MKIKNTTEEKKEFKSITIEITFESEEELTSLYDSQSTKFNNVFLYNFIGNIRKVIEGDKNLMLQKGEKDEL